MQSAIAGTSSKHCCHNVGVRRLFDITYLVPGYESFSTPTVWCAKDMCWDMRYFKQLKLPALTNQLPTILARKFSQVAEKNVKFALTNITKVPGRLHVPSWALPADLFGRNSSEQRWARNSRHQRGWLFTERPKRGPLPDYVAFIRGSKFLFVGVVGWHTINSDS